MVARLSNREIAEKQFLSEGTINQYINQIYSKLHIEDDTRTKRKQLNGLF
ncbi:MAG: LuxR C-terminal-related transcriptional regulator [Suilimivivens sp.]